MRGPMSEPSPAATEADPGHAGHNYKPYIPASANLPELGAVSLITGTVLGVVFGASSL